MENVNILFLLLQAVLTQQRPPPVYELEVYFVVDKSVSNRYVAEQTFGNPVRKGLASLKADFDYIVTEINELFASLRPKGLDIRILIKRLDVLKINLFADNVHKSVALQEFDNWLTAEGAYATVVYDAAILLTSLDFQQPGRAYFAQVCKSVHASGIVFYDMTYTVSIVTAHELAHIMGVDHDTDNSGYVMAPSISTTHTNRWQFSLASKNAFDDLFAKPSSSCLRRTTIDRTALSANMTVALANPDTICRRAKTNKGSYMCKNPTFYGNAAPQGDRVCTRIWCRKVNTKMCYPTFPSEGLICGKNKRCNDGTCQDHPDTESAVVDR